MLTENILLAVLYASIQIKDSKCYNFKGNQVITIRHNKMVDLEKQNAQVVTNIHTLIQVALYP